MIVGDIYENITRLVYNKEKYQVILLDNVLEHVIDPLQLLKDIKKLLESEGVLIVEVPNDFSSVQNHLLNSKKVHRPYWIAYPDHISYFNRNGLVNLCNEAGIQEKRVLGGYPIEFNLFNKNTNYIQNKQLGKSCHQSRIEIDNLIHSISLRKTSTLYQSLGNFGLGRDIVGFFDLLK